MKLPALYGIACFLIRFVWGEKNGVVQWSLQPPSIAKKIITGQKPSIEDLGCIASLSGSSEYVKTE